MQVIGINGSPRKQWNTATLVAKALGHSGNSLPDAKDGHFNERDGCELPPI